MIKERRFGLDLAEQRERRAGRFLTLSGFGIYGLLSVAFLLSSLLALIGTVEPELIGAPGRAQAAGLAVICLAIASYLAHRLRQHIARHGRLRRSAK